MSAAGRGPGAAGRSSGAVAGRRPGRDAAVLAGLLALGLFYLASFGWFLRTGEDFILRQRREALAGATLRPGEALPLGESGCAPCRVAGWNQPEPGFSWTRDAEAVLALPAPVAPAGSEEAPLDLVLDAAGAFLAAREDRLLEVRSDGRVLARLRLRKDDPRQAGFFRGEAMEHRVPLPAALLRDRTPLLLLLRTDPPDVPRAHVASDDRRPLGLAVRSARFEPSAR